MLIAENETRTADCMHKGLTEYSYVVDVVRKDLNGCRPAPEARTRQLWKM